MGPRSTPWAWRARCGSLHPSVPPLLRARPRHQVSGTLQAGTLRPGQKLLLLPGAEAVHAKAVHSRGVAVSLATAGDHVEVTPTNPPTHLPTRLPNHLPSDAVTHLPTCPHPLTRPTTGPLYLPTPNPQVGLVGCAADTSIAQGSVLCEPQRPVPLARQVEVRLRVFGVQARAASGLESRQCDPLRRGQGWA